MLIEMLKESKSFQSKNREEQLVLAKLANTFESDPRYLLLNPQDLAQMTGIGNKDMWFSFLNLDPTRNYIKAEMANQAQIAQRKAFTALALSAEQGNVQAAKEINELSGIMSQSDNNRIIVMHQISRPKVVRNHGTTESTETTESTKNNTRT